MRNWLKYAKEAKLPFQSALGDISVFLTVEQEEPVEQGESDAVKEPEAPEPRAFVKNLEGKSIGFTINRSDVVEALKCRIYDKEGVLPSEQRLIFAGKQLSDGEQLGTYSIGDNSTLHLVPQHSETASLHRFRSGFLVFTGILICIGIRISSGVRICMVVLSVLGLYWHRYLLWYPSLYMLHTCSLFTCLRWCDYHFGYPYLHVYAYLYWYHCLLGIFIFMRFSVLLSFSPWVFSYVWYHHLYRYLRPSH